MNETIEVQGRRLDSGEIDRIGQLIADHPEWSRRRLSEELCRAWDWRNGTGRLKDMATRSLLLKLESRGLVSLPARRHVALNRMRQQRIAVPEWEETPREGELGAQGPLWVEEVSGNPQGRTRFASALRKFHYLGFSGTIGENLQYSLTDSAGRLLACLLFGSPAWKCEARDQYIGWTSPQRCQRLPWVTNNTRFLILPSVRVPHLASWFLGQTLRRLSRDWQQKYGHPILLVETFVERQRFTGTCYRAANWIHVGETKGRSRQDRYHDQQVPVKDVYLYPLRGDFRRRLGQ
jgi:hypothetical protein